MQKLNQKALELLDYKRELLKDYPSLIKQSLYLALEKKLESKLIDNETFITLQDDDMPAKDFERYLQNKKTYLKTDEELYIEYELVRDEMQKELDTRGVGQLTGTSDPQAETITIQTKFSMDTEFTMSYFGVEEKEAVKMMSRKGFVEKFAALRLKKILHDWQEATPHKENLVHMTISPAYFDSFLDGYSIDLLFALDFDLIENPAMREDILSEVKRLVESAHAYFKQAT